MFDCLRAWCITFLFGFITLVSPLARADGCFVFKWNKAIDIAEPTQKAIIVHDAGREDLLLQVKYEGPLEEFGWLIPVPSLPKVEKGAMEPFYELSQLTQRQFGGGMTKGLATLGAASEGEEAVKVIEVKTVGAYEVAVLSARDADSLGRWLRAHDYSLPEGKSGIVDDYIRRGWHFVAAKIHLNKSVEASRKAVQNKLASGELHPLLISFDTPKCIFPLRISALNGKSSEVSLYVISTGPLLERFTFGAACAKLERSHAEWVEQRPQRIRGRQQSMESTRGIMLAAMMRKPDSPGRNSTEPHRTRNWSPEDLKALAREMTSPLPDDALGETFYATPEELLCQMRLERAKIPKCVKALPRLKGRDWRLTKLVWTFAPSGMQDLEFEPAIPALTQVLPQDSGVIAAELLARLGGEATQALVAACRSTNAIERLNAVSGLERARVLVPSGLLPSLLKDEAPQVRLHAVRCAEANWDQQFLDSLIALLRDPHPEIRQEASGCLCNHEGTNRTSFYLGLLNNPDPNVRAGALGVAFGINRVAGSDELFQATVRMLRDPNEDVQSMAVGVLLRSRQPVPKSDLLPLLNHPHPDTAAFVANLLRGGGRIRYVGDSTESSPPVCSADLAPLMTNRFGNVRLIGLRAMQDIADATAVELIVPLLRDTNSVIRSRAFDVVRAITGQTISEHDPAKWEAWWAANKTTFTPRSSSR